MYKFCDGDINNFCLMLIGDGTGDKKVKRAKKFMGKGRLKLKDYKKYLQNNETILRLY